MNEKILKGIVNTYDLLEKLENKERKEISVELLNGCAIVYYSEYMEKFFIHFVEKNCYPTDFKLLSGIIKNDFIIYVKVLTDNYLIRDEVNIDEI